MPLILWRCVNKMSTAEPSLKKKNNRGKWKCGREPSGAKSHQCFHAVPIKTKETGGGGESEGKKEGSEGKRK